MTANILNSPCIRAVSIYVVRAFVRLRELASTHSDLAKRLDELGDKTEALLVQGSVQKPEVKNDRRS